MLAESGGFCNIYERRVLCDDSDRLLWLYLRRLLKPRRLHLLHRLQVYIYSNAVHKYSRFRVTSIVFVSYISIFRKWFYPCKACYYTGPRKNQVMIITVLSTLFSFSFLNQLFNNESIIFLQEFSAPEHRQDRHSVVRLSSAHERHGADVTRSSRHHVRPTLHAGGSDVTLLGTEHPELAVSTGAVSLQAAVRWLYRRSFGQTTQTLYS